MKYNPEHIGIIMDGNGRWATRRGLPRLMGHRAGVKRLIKILPHIYDCGVHCVSLYAFSTENKFRPKEEVDNLIELLSDNLMKLADALKDKEIRFSVMGDIRFLPEKLKATISELIEASRQNTRGYLNIALNYGSVDEIIRAVNIAVKNGKELDAAGFSELLYSSGLPNLDLIIRTGGEKRLSNFMLFQAAYAELYFTDVLWPDFTEKEFDKAMNFYMKRDRRFGRV